MYSKKYIVGPSDADQNLNAKLSTLFVYMQDIAMEHAEVLKIGKSSTIDRGLMWVITRYSLTIKRLPRYLEEITVSTYPGDDMKFIFPRYFEMRDEKGNLLLTASSTWAVLNQADHHINFTPFPGITLPTEHHDYEEPMSGKIALQDASLIDTRHVRNSDVDINKHLNNTRYIEYLTDSHDYDFYRSNLIKHVTLEYKKEIKINQQVDIYSNSSNPEYIQVKVGEDICLIAEITYY